jgi:DNA-binding response OmpR family regulator
MTRRVLLVEDEPGLVMTLTDRLVAEGYEVESEGDAINGLARASTESFDAILLDVMLPGGSGLDICRSIRQKGIQTPVLMLTARDALEQKLSGFESGADDYMVKPFSPRELVARVKAVLRRTTGETIREVIRARDIVVDLPRHAVERNGRSIELTTSEFELLKTLAAQPGRVFTRGQLLDVMRGVSFESYERSIDAHIKNLRKKLEPDPHRPVYILTVYGVGYRFADA